MSGKKYASCSPLRCIFILPGGDCYKHSSTLTQNIGSEASNDSPGLAFQGRLAHPELILTQPRVPPRASFLQSGHALSHLSVFCWSVGFPSAATRLHLGVHSSCCFPCMPFPVSSPQLDFCPFSVMMLSEGDFQMHY